MQMSEVAAFGKQECRRVGEIPRNANATLRSAVARDEVGIA